MVQGATAVAQTLWAVSLALAALGLVLRAGGARRGDLLLDLAVGSAGVTALATVAWSRTVQPTENGGQGEVAIALAAVAIGLAVFAGFYPMLAGLRLRAVRGAMVGGLALVGTGHVVGLSQTPQLPRAGAAALVAAGIAAVGWAALLPPELAVTRSPGDGRAQFLPVVGAVAALGILVAGQYGRLPLAAVALAVLALVGAAARLLRTVGELRRLTMRRTDELTGLPNRRAFVEHMRDQLHRRHRLEGAAVLLLDFDRFKEVNDSLGHGAGDELLCELGRRLASVVEPGAFLGRLGGDEFAIFVDGGSDRSARRTGRAAAARRGGAPTGGRRDASCRHERGDRSVAGPRRGFGGVARPGRHRHVPGQGHPQRCGDLQLRDRGAHEGTAAADRGAASCHR